MAGVGFPVIPYLGKALTNLLQKPVTESFPSGEAPKARAGYRGRIAYDAAKCINCGMCERVCAPHCMTRTQEATGEPGEMKITFTFDMTSCTYCGLCADFCAKKAIELTDDYMIVGSSKEDFLVTGSFIKKAPPAKPKPTPEQLAAMKAAAEAKKKAAEAAKAADSADAKPAGESRPGKAAAENAASQAAVEERKEGK